MRICSIICGAPCGKLPAELVEGLVIAADRGLDHCLKAGITPHYAVGDFDSARSTVPEGVERIVAPAEKDDTDTGLAVNIGIEHGCEEFRLFCALGGRLDHTIACIQTLLSIRKDGKKGVLYGDGCEAMFALNETISIPEFSGYLSVFAFEGEAVVSIRGTKYCVEDYVLKNTYPIGVSNEVAADFAEIEAAGGAVLIIKQEYDN
ncbi:MAG: thiamine diphosphokinase [Oscillospiraceae bacterium]